MWGFNLLLADCTINTETCHLCEEEYNETTAQLDKCIEETWVDLQRVSLKKNVLITFDCSVLFGLHGICLSLFLSV